MHPNRSSWISAALVVVATTGTARAEAGTAYVRTLEGTGVLHAADVSAPGGSVEADERGIALNAPLLVGDRIAVDAGSRLEIVLPDGSVLRIGARSTLSLDALAAAESGPDTTRAFLDFGALQWITPERTVGREEPRLDLSNATIYLGGGGSYHFETDGQDWSAVTVREGWVDVLTPEGSARLRAGEGAEVRGRGAVRRVAADAALSELERWGGRLDDEVRWSDLGEVDSHLRYGAARMSTHGGWVVIDGRRAWRPWRVAAGWRPFLDGRWVYTPGGWTWVSTEPWGWTTSHYGSWDYVPGYGWAWFPGSTYAPAWVYWYWGNGSAGWCPSGYYSRYYRLGSTPRFGVYGWAGGGGFGFDDWIFCATRNLRSRNLRDHCRRGRDYFDRGVAPRGIITTDTRLLTRDLLDHGDDPVTVLRHAVRRNLDQSVDDLPDVSDFVSRRRNLSANLVRVVESPRELPRPGREPFPTAGGASTGSAGSGAAPGDFEGREPWVRDNPTPSRPRPAGGAGASSSPGYTPREPFPSSPGRPRIEPRPSAPPSPPQPIDRGSAEPPVRRVIDGTRTPRGGSSQPAPRAPVVTPRPSSPPTSSGPSGSSDGSSTGSGREPARGSGASAGGQGSGSRSSGERSRDKEKSDAPPPR